METADAGETVAGRPSRPDVTDFGCIAPCTGFPSISKPPPTPVPTVMYHRLGCPWPAPQRYSARAAPFTSVSIVHGHASPALRAPATSAPVQRALGVLCSRPNAGEFRRSSSGPNEAIPRADSGASLFQVVRLAHALSSVSAGVVVGIVCCLTTVPSLASTTIVFVPPSSTPAKRTGDVMSRCAAACWRRPGRV